MSKTFKKILCLFVLLITFFLGRYFCIQALPSLWLNQMQEKNSVKPLKIFQPAKNDIPSEVYNKNSPFYGMIYKNVYGLPITAFPSRSLEDEVPEWWGNYFSSLILSMEKDIKQNPNQNPSLFTQSGIVTTSKTIYNQGDEFEATITSVYGSGKPKSCGGDYYRARLIRRDGEYTDGIPCKVHDNGDGTYSVKAPLVLNGTLTLDVKLVHVLQGIKEIVNVTTASIPSATFTATLGNEEVVKCGQFKKWYVYGLALICNFLFHEFMTRISCYWITIKKTLT